MTPTWWRLINMDTSSQPQKQVWYVRLGGPVSRGGLNIHTLLATQRTFFRVYEDQ